MKKENLFSDEFLKRFKSGNGFLKRQKRDIKKMFEGELDDHFDYIKAKSLTIPIPAFGQKKGTYSSWGIPDTGLQEP
ncbi:hypothetical protein [Salegentibacter sp. Hel_I_6]|uniref:hypothetical protein n=1 Tax=Salegentibacter sp. Hel_I_6 TaxID=1250278 RepID=UPI001E544B43|nr:hypothetical protein [Salegentibacter sp. Hel_I_6]